MTPNVINLKEIDMFLNELKNNYSCSLIHVFIDYKVRKLIIKNHSYQNVQLNFMNPEEKELVKHKPGVYQRAILSSDLRTYIISKCDQVGILIVRGNIKTPQDVTNLEDIPPMKSFGHYPEVIWMEGPYSVRVLDTKALLNKEGLVMNNCLKNATEKDFKHSLFFSLTKDEKPYISFRVRKKSFKIKEAKYKFNEVISKEDRALIERFVKEKYKLDDNKIYIDPVVVSGYLWCLVFGFIGFWGSVSYIGFKIGNDFLGNFFSFLLTNESIFFWGFFLSFFALFFIGLWEPEDIVFKKTILIPNFKKIQEYEKKVEKVAGIMGLIICVGTVVFGAINLIEIKRFDQLQSHVSRFDSSYLDSLSPEDKGSVVNDYRIRDIVSRNFISKKTYVFLKGKGDMVMELAAFAFFAFLAFTVMQDNLRERASMLLSFGFMVSPICVLFLITQHNFLNNVVEIRPFTERVLLLSHKNSIPIELRIFQKKELATEFSWKNKVIASKKKEPLIF